MRRQDKEQYNADVTAHISNVEHDRQMCELHTKDKILLTLVGCCAVWHIVEALVVFFE